MLQFLQKPHNFMLQWHITERCNYTCRHCYLDDSDPKTELPYSTLVRVLDQYFELIRLWSLPPGDCQIYISGGEPLLRADVFELFQEIHDRPVKIRWGIQSNGSLLSETTARRLKTLGIHAYQVSIEGLENHNDSVRGPGSFKRVMAAIQLLRQENIRVTASLTLTRGNCFQVPELARILADEGVAQLNTRRLRPAGRGSALRARMLSPSELKSFYSNVTSLNAEYRSRHFRIYIGCESALYNDEPGPAERYDCGIYYGRLLTIMANGDVFPCARSPIRLGNVQEQSLFEMYYSSNDFWQLMNLNNAHPLCKSCSNFGQCLGGAPCVTSPYFGRLLVPDPQCWHVHDHLPGIDAYHGYSSEVHTDVTTVYDQEAGDSAKGS